MSSTASSLVDETLINRAGGRPSVRDSGLSTRVVKTSGGFPSQKALYTTVLPSGVKRARSTKPRRNVS
jgi:hypothetical protein